MARIDHLHSDLGMWGRVLNIHPAVTEAGHPYAFPGKTPTQDAIDRANSGEITRTGATLHVVDSVIDAGPIIAYTADTPVYPGDEPQWLRFRNYSMGKLPLLVEGLAHYVQSIYPYLDRIDLRSMERVRREES
jgi:folate-dependent phosphoribosylglycinamide formyltransferase PurN